MKKFLVLPLLFALSCSDSDHPTEVFVPTDGEDTQVIPTPTGPSQPVQSMQCSFKDVANGVEYHCGDDVFTIFDGKDACQILANEDGSLVYACEGTYPITLNPPRGSSEPQVIQGHPIKGDKGDKGDPGSKVHIWTDHAGCLWISIDNGNPIKIRGPL